MLQAHSIAADYDDRFIYWAEKSNDNAGIYKSTLDGAAYDTVVSLGIEVVEDLDVDWVGRNIYFADSGRKIIAGCDLHGTTRPALPSSLMKVIPFVRLYPCSYIKLISSFISMMFRL